MVKSKNTSLMQESFGLLSSIYNFKKFESKVSKSAMILYSGVFLVLISLIGYLNNSYVNSDFSNYQDIFSILFGLPVLFFIVYGLFYIFLRTFEEKYKDFFESFLVFTSIIIPFFLIGHIISFILNFIKNEYGLILILFIFMIFFVYFFVNFVLNFKHYFNTTGFKIITSIFLVNVLIIVISLIFYVSQLITSLN